MGRTLKEVATDIFKKLDDSNLSKKQLQEIMMDIGTIAMRSTRSSYLSEVDELVEYITKFAKEYVNDSDDIVVKLFGSLL